MQADGRPVHRRERGTDEDVLSGADFLSVLMRSSYYQSYTELSTHLTTMMPVTSQPTTADSKETHIRHSRSTPYLPTAPQPQNEEHTSVDYDSAHLQDIEIDKDYTSSTPSSDSSEDNGVIIAVSVSSSVGRKGSHGSQGGSGLSETMSTMYIDRDLNSNTEYRDQSAVASEEHPAIVAKSSKRQFSVDESEPITTNSDLLPGDFDNNRDFPANVRPLPRLSDPSKINIDIQPFHQSVIFHDNPQEPSRARSVSYSAVIQTVPHSEGEKNSWSDDKDLVHDRRERHYDGTNPSANNDFSQDAEKRKLNLTRTSPSEAETNHYYVTTNPDNEQSIEKNWEQPQVYVPEIPVIPTTTSTTERTWEQKEKAYTASHPNLPSIYGRPEQNYEVDETVSVMSNGRVHGVQPSQPQNTPRPDAKVTQSAKKADDNQKVGYVVEGRNYRKYRVEERTSDGFIVGEYGVVSHDDGSLRGVRYTADGTINPRLIYDALMKFLSL